MRIALIGYLLVLPGCSVVSQDNDFTARLITEATTAEWIPDLWDLKKGETVFPNLDKRIRNVNCSQPNNRSGLMVGLTNISDVPQGLEVCGCHPTLSDRFQLEISDSEENHFFICPARRRECTWNPCSLRVLDPGEEAIVDIPCSSLEWKSSFPQSWQTEREREREVKIRLVSKIASPTSFQKVSMWFRSASNEEKASAGYDRWRITNTCTGPSAAGR